ncbi:hypothetical protein [Streptomyces liangshanensis]|uniref:hypothetical protein n=1 Tax=Streptomyces liangshanensis TaxID=2717324 RepID=UPI0036DA1D8E
MRHRGVLLLVVVMAAVLSGCGTEPAPRPGSAVAVRPLTEAEKLRIGDAQQRLIRRCMAAQGFRYWEAERLSLEESRTLGYVSDDVDWAREHGYGSRILAREDRARRANPNGVYRAGLPGDRRRAYDKALDEGLDARIVSVDLPTGGTVRKRVGGCVGESERELYGDPVTWFRAEKTVGSLQPLYVPKVMADRRFAAALGAWSRCMERAGHPYKDPAAARTAGLRATAGPGAVTAGAFRTERSVAVADARCARETSLRSVGRESEAHQVDLLRDKYGDALDTYARLRSEALARAVRIVGPRT